MEVGKACSLLICLSATLILCKAYIFIEPKNPTVNEHQSLSLYCNTTNNVSFNFTWTKKTELDNIFQSNSNNLTFDRILRTHAGYYICNASYQGLTYINYSLVTVRYSPDITRLTSNTTTVNMSQITLECNTTGNPTPNVSFYKDGKRLNSSKGQVVLTLSPVLVQDSGLYTCEASNPLGNKSKTTYLDVQYPTKVSKPDHNLTINAWLGKSISQGCKAIGNPTPNVTWYWNNTVVSTTGVLNITITSGDQFGVYRCFAWNNLGNVSRDIHLNRTRFRPGITKIINNVTLLSSQNITLKWSKPNEYGSNITQYIVWKQKIYKNGTQERWESYSSPSTNHKKYFNLTWEASYRFYVTAKNRQGKRDGEKKNFSVIDAPTIKPAEHEKEHELPLLVIVGSAAVGLVVLIIVICVLCYFRCKESTNDKKPSCPKEGNFNHSVLMDDLTSPYGDNVGSPNSPTERYSKTHRALTDIHQESASCSEQAAIYDNVSFDDKSVQGWEIPRDNVRIEKIIGKGAFCQVAKAFVKGLGTVAVKMIRSKNKGNKSSISNREDLLAEYELLQHLGQHENVILVLGGVTTTDPVMVFFEYVPYGDLLGYLRRSRGLTDTYYTDPDIKPKSSLTSKQLLRFSREIADGMAFISSKKIIHRDLAARNVLVGQGETCKITDFGMARDVKMDDIYQKKRRGGLPVKWTAYEALLYGFYSTQSDIWSYAIVLYEIFTIGGSPYPGISPRDIAEQIYKEYRMPKPKHLDDEIYALMCECWKTTPDKRPSFESISSTLRRLERHEKDYIHMMDYEKDLYANLDEL